MGGERTRVQRYKVRGKVTRILLSILRSKNYPSSYYRNIYIFPKLVEGARFYDMSNIDIKFIGDVFFLHPIMVAFIIFANLTTTA